MHLVATPGNDIININNNNNNTNINQVMQSGMPQEISSHNIMTEQRLVHSDETAHAGDKRARYGSPVQSEGEGDHHHDHHHYPPSPNPSSDKIVQTTKSKGIVNVQLFIRKAFAMINECDPNIATWTEEGDKFVVKNKDIFASTVIPQYYDHNNYSSFTRQLNFYGFTREQSMTIKVSDLNSLAVGQETFYHQHFQRGRPDLLKNLQRRSSDTKNSKKRKKPRTADDMSFLQGRLESMEETTKEMLASMKQMREENFAAAAAIQDLQNQNAVKDEKINALEKRIVWLENRLNTTGAGSASTGIHRQESYLNPTQRLLGSDVISTAAAAAKAWQDNATTVATTASAFAPTQQQQQQQQGPPTEVSFPTTDANGAPTLARHPKMKKFLGAPPTDIFSYENATTNISNQGATPSRETSLDFGLFTSSLARESTLLSWLPRQETEKTPL